MGVHPRQLANLEDDWSDGRRSNARDVTRDFLRTYAFPSEVERAAADAESDGWDGLLFQDSQNLTPDVTVSMTLAARVTQRLIIGTAVTSLVTRNPAVVASTFATLRHRSTRGSRRVGSPGCQTRESMPSR